MNFINGIRNKAHFSLERRFYICTVMGNFLLCVIGLIAAPSVIAFSKLHMNIQKPAMIGLSVALIIIAGVFITLLGYFSRQHAEQLKNEEIKGHIKRMGIFILGFICFYFIWFLICGLIASMIYLILHQAFSYTQIKIVIDIMTTIATVLVIPVVFMQLLSFSLSELPVKNIVRKGLKALRVGYLKLLIIAIALMISGTLFTWLFSLFEDGTVRMIFQVVVFTAFGSISTCIIYEIGIRIYGKGERTW